MKHFWRKYAMRFTLSISVVLLVACANIASPPGGAYDLEPPKLVKSSPAINATEVRGKKIELEFNENVTVKDQSEKIIITPPQKAFPKFSFVNKRISIELRDSLIPNTTYTIDFTDGIEDTNEGNPLENFAFSFSTGGHIDSLTISGKVLAAENLEPSKGLTVGLHSNLSDTAFTHIKFLRISRTSESGDFSIKGVAPGKYKIYALNDINRDYMYNNPAAEIAFLDSIIVPSLVEASRIDTIFSKDKFDENNHPLMDSLKTVKYTRYLPDDLLLRSFKSSFKRKYLQKHERSANKLILYFGAPTNQPDFEPLNFSKVPDWSVLERSAMNDTLTYWIKDPKINSIDTLSFQLSYLKTDSLNNDVISTDTLNFIDRKAKPKKKEKEKKEDKPEEIKFLEIKHNITSTWDVYKDIILEFSEPIKDSLDSKIISLYQIEDSVHTDLNYLLFQDTLNPRKYSLKYKWKYGAGYGLRIDSASIHSIYNLWNNTLTQEFKTKKDNEYGMLGIFINGIGNVPAFVELLNTSDIPVRTAKVWDGAVVFKNVAPGKYYARIILDRNNNGRWDTGDYYKDLQPEIVSYSNKEYEVKANWHIEETWNVDTVNLAKQKPLEITKNKPKDKDKRRKELEEKDKKRRNNTESSDNQKSNLPTGMSNTSTY